MNPKRAILTLILAISGTVLLAGCQSTGNTVADDPAAVCPMCKMETKTVPFTNLTYEKMVCPGCKTVKTEWQYEREPATIHVCSHCEAAVALCPKCAAK